MFFRQTPADHDAMCVEHGKFTDMVNAGATFQQALSAIYVSGMQNAIAAGSERQQAQEGGNAGI